MDTTLFWVLVVVAVVVSVYILCRGKNMPTVTVSTTTKPTSTSSQLRPSSIRRHATLTVEHDGPLLGSLFSKEVEALPEGINREEFERAVSNYQNQHLKEVEVKIPRSMNFNYDKYASEQEAMRRNVSAVASSFIGRGEVGSISEQLAKGVPSQTFAPRSFHKKPAARRH